MSNQKSSNIHEDDLPLGISRRERIVKKEQLIITEIELVKMMRYWIKSNHHNSNN